MSTGVDCQVYIDGVRVADGRPGDDPTAPTVLSGLSFDWGRSSTVDQPDASSCSFQLLDEHGGTSFLQLVRTGLPVDVVATGTVYTDPDTSTVLDPSFDTTPIGETPGSVRSTNAFSTVQLAPGARQALRIVPKDAGTADSVLIAPAPFSAAPGAWDEIPATVGGQTWSVSVDVFAPVGAAATVQPVMIFDPAGNRVENVGTPITAAGTGTFATLTTKIVPPAPGAWIGVRVRVYPTGPRWVDAPGTWAATPGTWLDRAIAYVDDVMILAPESGLIRSVLVFSGRVTDVAAGYDDAADAPVVDVTAVDFTADLDNVRIGDEPWPVETFATRFDRVVTLAGLEVDPIIDDGLTGYQLSYQDVDSQPATGLLKDYSQSVDGVMWSATHQTTGPYLHVEDTTARTPLFELQENPAGLVVIVPSTATGVGQEISACDVLRAPVTWEQSVADVATRVAVTWLEQGVDEEGKATTTERTVTLVDDALEATYGQRGVSVSTLLADADDARDVASRILTRTSIVGWRVTGLTIDDDESLDTPDDVAVAMLLRLLDGTSRNGLPIILTDLPAWSPLGPSLPVYLEGGTYTHEAGTWTLELTVSRAEGQGRSVEWDELDPEWAWVDFDPAIAWDDLVGVGVTTGDTP